MTTTTGTDLVAVRLLDSIAATIDSNRFQYHDERALQDTLADLFVGVVEREVRLDARNRIDLLVTDLDRRVGIEVKVAGSKAGVQRQLARYAEHDDIDALVLVTTRRTHRHMPHAMFGKPLRVVVVNGALA